MFQGLRAAGDWSGERGTNLLDTGAYFYEVYETADGRYISLGALDPRSHELLVRLTGLTNDDDRVPDPDDRSAWPSIKDPLGRAGPAKTRDEWCRLLEGTDVCFAPVLEPGEAPDHPHNRARGTFVEVDGVVQTAPAPRFSRTAPGTPGASAEVGRAL